MENKKCLVLLVCIMVSFSSLYPMLKSSCMRIFFNHNMSLDESALGLFNVIVRNKELCKRSYRVLYHHRGSRSYEELLYRADMKLSDVRMLIRKCHQLQSDEQFVKAMIKDVSLERQLKDLHCELDGERIKLQTFIFFVKKSQQSGPL